MPAHTASGAPAGEDPSAPDEPRRSQVTVTNGQPPGGFVNTLREKPWLAALLIGGAFVLLVGAILVFANSGGDSNSSGPARTAQGPDLPAANGAILLTPQGTATSAAGASTPTSAATQAPTQAPSPSAPTATPEPPTPVPAGVTPVPIPVTSVPPSPTPRAAVPTPTPLQTLVQPTPVPPVNPNVPPARTSNLVGITVNGGQGSVHKVGEELKLTYHGPANSTVKVYNNASPVPSLFFGKTTGNDVPTPVVVFNPGVYTFRIDLMNGDQVQDSATVSVQVVP